MSEEKKDKTIQYIEEFLKNDYESLRTSLESLLKDYDRKSKRLDKIIKQSDKQQQELISLNEELDRYKNSLEQRVEEEIAARKQKEAMLFQQSKLAAMGEMMDAIAHQWNQPITIIKLYIQMMSCDYEDGRLKSAEYVEELQKKIESQIEHMTNTLYEFRNFFRPNKQIESFDVKSMIDKVLLIVQDELIKNKIEVAIEDRQNFEITGIENEFKHLVLNIINNAKDAFNDNDVEDREIRINLLDEGGVKKIEIIDNAGGIPEHLLDTIFDANVTTKSEGKGTGIGLYMSAQIAEKHNGKLFVSNVEGGAKFTFAKED